GTLMAAIIFVFTAAILTTAAATPLVFMLERTFPSNHGIDLDQLRERDASWHGRTLMSSDGVVAFHLYGTALHPIGYKSPLQLAFPSCFCEH
ncbi:hypothetical protein L195_g053218, partial [Trifolium pratense]